MGEVIDIRDRKLARQPDIASTYGVSVNLDKTGDVVSGSVSDWGPLAAPEMRTVADHLERLAFFLRLDAEQGSPEEDKDRIATVHVFRSSRVRVWTHGDVETAEQVEWIRGCLEQAKSIVTADEQSAQPQPT
jgi:hypothetical protein